MTQLNTPGPLYDDRYVNGMIFRNPKHPLADQFEKVWQRPGVWFIIKIYPTKKAAYKALFQLRTSNKHLPRGTYHARSRMDPRTNQGLLLLRCLDQDSVYTLFTDKQGHPAYDPEMPLGGVDGPVMGPIA